MDIRRIFDSSYYLSEQKHDWIRYEPRFNFGFILSKCEYFDERPVIDSSITQLIAVLLFPFLISISTSLSLFLSPLILVGFGRISILLPIKSGLVRAESPEWGFCYDDDTIWIYYGENKFYGIEMPWILKWYRTSFMLPDGSWVSEYKWDENDFWDSDKWGDVILKFDVLTRDGNIGYGTIKEVEWRRKIFFNFSTFNLIRKTVEINFEKINKFQDASLSFDFSSQDDILRILGLSGFRSRFLSRLNKINSLNI